MIYYAELDREKEFVEVKSCKSIDMLSKILKTSWGDIDYYLNGEDQEVRWLPCGVRMPFVKKNGKVYLISAVEGYIENFENTPFLSKKILDDIAKLKKYDQLPIRRLDHCKKEVSDKADTDIIDNRKPFGKHKPRYSNADDEFDEITDTIRYYTDNVEEMEMVIELENTYHTEEELKTLKIVKALNEELNKGKKRGDR